MPPTVTPAGPCASIGRKAEAEDVGAIFENQRVSLPTPSRRREQSRKIPVLLFDTGFALHCGPKGYSPPDPPAGQECEVASEVVAERISPHAMTEGRPPAHLERRELGGLAQDQRLAVERDRHEFSINGK